MGLISSLVMEKRTLEVRFEGKTYDESWDVKFSL
jgi:hypothetical protein